MASAARGSSQPRDARASTPVQARALAVPPLPKGWLTKRRRDGGGLTGAKRGAKRRWFELIKETQVRQTPGNAREGLDNSRVAGCFN